MFIVQFIYFVVIYIFRPIFSITVEIDGRIDLGHSWQHENLTTMQEIQTYPPFLRTFKTDKMDIKYASTSEEKDTTTVKAKVFKNIFDFNKNDSEGKYKKENKAKRGGKKKNKKTTQIESLDHDNLDLDDILSVGKKNKKKSVTKIVDTDESDEVKTRKVKEDTKINDFIQHIFKQTLKFLDDIKMRTDDDKLKYEVGSLKRTFKDKFGKYISETYNHTLRTNLGEQKIILNTIDTSHKTLQRLINNLYKDMDKEALRTNIGAVNIFQKEIDREKDLENKHACQELRICRLNDEFSDFVSDVIVILVQSDDRKIKQAADALTEVVKNIDFDNVLNYDLQIKLKKHMTNMEHWDAFMTRAMFLFIKRLISNKNKPIAIYNNKDSYLANKTIAFQEIIGLVDEKLPKNENVQEWEKIKQDVIAWKENKNNNALEIAQNFVKHFKGKALDKLDYEGKRRFNKSMEILLSHLSQ